MTTPKKPNVPDDPRTRKILEHIKPEFLERGARKICREDVQEVVRSADTIRAEFHKQGAMKRFEKDAELLLQMLDDYWEGTLTSASLWSVALATFSFLYVLKPVDIIPDTLPMIGQLDDAIVVSLCLSLVRDDLEAYRLLQREV